MPPPYGDCAGLPGLERVLRGVGTDRRRAHRRAPGQWWAGTGRRPALKIADVVFSSCGRRSGPPRDSRKSPARRPGGVVAAPVIRVEALGRLPDGPAGSDPFWRLAAAFLVAYPDSTARAYLGDLKAWAAWCADRGVHPFAARRHHVDTWVKFLGRDPQPATGRPAAPATVARWLSCLSRFYDYGMREIELIEHSPVANVRRPKVSEDSPTISPPRTATVSHGEHRHRRAGRPLAGTRRVHHYHHRHRHPHRVRRHRPTLVAEDSYIAPGDSFLTDTPN